MLLQLDHITKSFGTHKVLDDVCFTLDKGEAMAILGANGAGKTTLLRIINRLLVPDSGQVFFDGHTMEQDDLSQIGYLPEERGLYRRMRAGEQVCYLARLKGLSSREARHRAQQWFERLGVTDWWNRPVSRLSKGMQQKVQFIATVAHTPRLLILDEPFSGFDQENAAMLKHEITALRSEGTAILLSTHNLQAADELCTKKLHL